MTDLKTEYGSMDSAARHLRTAIGHLPEAVARFRHATASVDAFGHLPEAARAKHTVTEAMTRLAESGEDLHAEWGAEARALTLVADVLRQVDRALAHRAQGRQAAKPTDGSS